MRIFLAGGTGVLGRGLIPRLVAAGHQVTATTRRADRTDLLTGLGATPSIVDVFDAAALAEAVAAANPDLIVHMLTDLSGFDLEANARLRREGTTNLIMAAKAADVERIIVQSVAWVFPDDSAPATEDDPSNSGTPVDVMEQAARTLPHATIVRFGTLYGPGTWYAADGYIAGVVKNGALPATPAVTCFIHIDDAITATVQALDWPDGTYLITDDEPAPATTWLPVYASALDAPEPVTAPADPEKPLGRPVSNAKARATGWDPAHATWREGFGHL